MVGARTVMPRTMPRCCVTLYPGTSKVVVTIIGQSSFRSKHDASALAESNARVSRLLTESTHDDFIAILKKSSLGSITERDGLSAAPGAFKQTATRFLRRARDRARAEQIANAHVATVGCVMREQLCGRPEHVAERSARNVFDIRPGITGLAQIQGIDMSTPVLLAETDAKLLVDLTITTYLRCIFLTIIGAGSGDRLKTK